MPLSVLANTVIASTGRVVNVAVGIAVTAFITRVLGPEKYGVFTLLLAFGLIAQLVADFGLYLTMTRDIARQPARCAEIVSHTVSLRIFLLLCVFVLAVVVLPLLPSLYGWRVAFIVMLVGLGFQSLSQLLMGVYQYYGEVWRATAGDFLGRIIQLAILFILGMRAASVQVVTIVFAVSAGMAFVVHQLLLPTTAWWKVKVNPAAWKKIATASWPLGLMLVLNAVYFRVDTVMLSFFWPATEVGRYGLAYRIIESSLFFPAMLGGLLLPRLSEAFGGGEIERAKNYIDEAIRLLLVVGVLGGVVLGCFSQYVVVMVAGVDFLGAASLLAILGVAMVVMFVGNIYGFALVALKKQLILLKLYAALVVFNIVANLMFIPVWGASAAAWTTVVTEVLSMTVAALIVGRLVAYRLQVDMLAKIMLAALGAVAVIWLTGGVGWWWQLMLGVCMYVLVVFLLGVVEKRQFILLRSV